MDFALLCSAFCLRPTQERSIQQSSDYFKIISFIILNSEDKSVFIFQDFLHFFFLHRNSNRFKQFQDISTFPSGFCKLSIDVVDISEECKVCKAFILLNRVTLQCLSISFVRGVCEWTIANCQFVFIIRMHPQKDYLLNLQSSRYFTFRFWLHFAEVYSRILKMYDQTNFG